MNQTISCLFLIKIFSEKVMPEIDRSKSNDLELIDDELDNNNLNSENIIAKPKANIDNNNNNSKLNDDFESNIKSLKYLAFSVIFLMILSLDTIIWIKISS